MHLANDEKAMLDGAGGVAKQKAMELLVRYAEALGADRFVDTRNIAGVPGSSTLFLQKYFEEHAGDGVRAFCYGELLPLTGRDGSAAFHRLGNEC
jgi:hypothetical protein